MRGLNAMESERVGGGSAPEEYPPGPNRDEREREMNQLRDFIEEKNRRNALVLGG